MSAGEKLLGRSLAKERREGVDHFVPGQHEATIERGLRDWLTDEPIEVGRITYVDQMGHACVVLTIRPPGGEWKATWIGRAGQVTAEPAVQAPDDFVLSETMFAALSIAKDATPSGERADSE